MARSHAGREDRNHGEQSAERVHVPNPDGRCRCRRRPDSTTLLLSSSSRSEMPRGQGLELAVRAPFPRHLGLRDGAHERERSRTLEAAIGTVRAPRAFLHWSDGPGRRLEAPSRTTRRRAAPAAWLRREGRGPAGPRHAATATGELGRGRRRTAPRRHGVAGVIRGWLGALAGPADRVPVHRGPRHVDSRDALRSHGVRRPSAREAARPGP